MKRFKEFSESYEMEMEKYDDFAEEHAKAVIADYIDRKLDGVTLQDAFESMCRDNDLEEDNQYIVMQSLIELTHNLNNQAKKLELCKPAMTKQQELDAGKKPIGDNPGAL